MTVVMAMRQVVAVTDDMNGREGAETVTFAYAGRSYLIDLDEKNKAKLGKTLEPFILGARKAGGPRRPSARKASGSPLSVDLNAVRAWATEQGIEFGKRGRVAKTVLDAFRQAH